MTRTEMVFILRQNLSDEQKVGWPFEEELIAYLDRAADFLSEHLIAGKDPTMLKKLNAGGSTLLPGDFVSFAGNVPVRIIGRQYEVYGDPGTDVLYWANLPAPSSFSPTVALPYTREQSMLIIDAGRIFALNKNEYDISQDMALLGEAIKAVSAARKG
jgi:hypothetical protein